MNPPTQDYVPRYVPTVGKGAVNGYWHDKPSTVRHVSRRIITTSGGLIGEGSFAISSTLFLALQMRLAVRKDICALQPVDVSHYS